MRREAAALAALGAIALGGAAVLALALQLASGDRPDTRAVSLPDAAPLAAELRLPVEPAVPTPAPTPARVEPSPTSARVAALSPENERRVERARRELAQLLLADSFDPVSFDIAVRGLARGIDGGDGTALRACFSDRKSTLEERLATCELLREMEERGALVHEPLPPDVLVELDSLALAPAPSATAESAARALAALSSDGARRLIDSLLGADEALRERSARALAHARDPAAASELARALGAADDPRTLELATVALSAVLQKTRLALTAEAREEIRAELEGLMRTRPDPDRRALIALAELGADPVSELFALAGDDGLALVTPFADASTLEGALLDGRATPQQRFAIAEALARSLARAPESASANARLSARDTLLECAGEENDPALRRRALYALGTLDDAAAVSVLRDTVRFDPDPTLRAAGLRSLGDLDQRDMLLLVADTDPSPELRALAARELARADGSRAARSHERSSP